MYQSGVLEFTPQFFDESSKAWLENKVKCGAGYAYKCEYIHSNQKHCKKPATNNNLCKQHYILNVSKNVSNKTKLKSGTKMPLQELVGPK